MTDRSPDFLAALAAKLPDDAISTTDPQTPRFGSTGDRDTPPLAVVYPADVEQVRAVVLEAKAHRVPLHPISRGKNWGYGDAQPPGAGQVVLDLGRMNRILEVNTELAYCVIEPGVTQGQLHTHLRDNDIPLWMDSSGAGLSSSLVGNTLDRGFGHTRYGDHFLTCCGMEVVLPDGRVLHTGFGHYDPARAHRVYRYGVGPFLDGLFAQSNLGIVTRIGLWLMPKPEAFSAFFFSTEDEDGLPGLVERLAPLRMQGLLQSTIHIGNDLRVLSARTRYPWDQADGQTPLPPGLRRRLRKEFGVAAWTGGGGIYGTPATVKAMKHEVRKALHGYRVIFADDRKIARLSRLQRLIGRTRPGRRLGELLGVIDPVYGLMKGRPTDQPLRGAGWRKRGDDREESPDPLRIDAGLMWLAPILPSHPKEARDLLELMEPIYQAHGFDMLATFTMITERAMVCVSNISFDRQDPQEMAAARRCYDELFDRLMAQGFVPYRTGPGGYDKLRHSDDVFWDVTAQIKQAIDPDEILSPGRYIAVSTTDR